MRRATLLGALVTLLLLAGVVFADTTQIASVDWWVMSGGGAPVASSSGNVTLNGSLGQTAIGWSDATHGGLGAGFWYGAGEGIYTVYLPLVLRNY